MGKKKTSVQKQPEKTIELVNFGFFDIQYVGITLTVDKEQTYGAALLFHSKCDEEGQTTEALHHELETVGTLDEVLRNTIMGVVLLYGQEVLLDQVMVFDEDGKMVDEFSLTSYNEKMAKKESRQSRNLVTRGA